MKCFFYTSATTVSVSPGKGTSITWWREQGQDARKTIRDLREFANRFERAVDELERQEALEFAKGN